MNSNQRTTALLAMTSFAIYFGMYALRKPFAAGTWGHEFWGVSLKVWLVSSQLMGYASAKWWGIRLVSQLKRNHQKFALWWMFGAAYASLLMLAVIPNAFKLIALFANGLALGMVWGVLFRYLEGRKATEFLGIFLSCSFVVSSGAVKSIGFWAMVSLNIPEVWMPLATGLMFAPVLWFSLNTLDSLPGPSSEDHELRTERVAMGAQERRTMLREVGLGVTLISVAYVLLTALRDIRDNFAVELWQGLGVPDAAAQLTQSEWPITLVVLAVFAGMTRIRSNHDAFAWMLRILLLGSLLIGASTWVFALGWVTPYGYMFALGLGLYLAYIPITSILFDRLIGALELRGNVGFLIYIADAAGYLGTTALMFGYRIHGASTPWLDVIHDLTYFVSVAASLLILGTMWWFRRKSTLQPIEHA